MLKCHDCPLTFGNPEELCKHIKKHHRGSNVYRCTICKGVVFTELWKYKRHLNNGCFKPNVSEEVGENIALDHWSEFEKAVDRHALTLVCKLASNMSFPRKHTFEMIKEFQDFYTFTVLEGFEKYVKPRVNYGDESEVECFLQIVREPFRSIDSEDKLDSELQKADLISSFDRFNITDNMENGNVNKPEYGVLMPLAYQFKKFFELSGVFELTQKFTAEISNDNTISHFMNASVWKKKLESFNATDTVIPFHIHIDDTQVNNALGSHRSKGLETCCYYSFPSVPPQYSSRLENVFAAQLLQSDANKHCGNLACFKNLIEELNNMAEHPVTLCVGGKEVKVFFLLGLILGDNKGINDFGGFAKSHNASHFCRFCSLSKSQTQIRTTQNNARMRNPQNYEEDLVKDNPQSTGIVENSIVNLIYLCHATYSLGIDIMHDLFEGILHYNMSAAILKFIEKGYFTLNKLNQLKNDFNFGEVDSGDKSPPITMRRLKCKKLLMSASEMQSFFHHFGLIVGDLVPKNDEIWKFYLQTTKVVDLCFLPAYAEIDLLNLTSAITKMNAMYKKHFNDTLKPKHHYVTHYPTMIRRFGPLYYISSMRYEAKHKMVKNYTKNTTCRKDLSYSLGKKLQYNFAYRLLTNIGLQDNVIMGPSKYLNLEHSGVLSKLSNPEPLQHLLKENLKESLKVSINGIRFSTKLYMVFRTENKLTLQQIKKIVFVDDEISNIFFICEEFPKVVFNKNFECYEVNTSCEANDFKVIGAVEALNERQHPVTVQVVAGNNNFRFRAKRY